MTVHIFDGNNVMLRDLDSATHQRIGLRQRLRRADTEFQIWVWDGAGHNQRRREIYPPYKMQREPSAEDRYAQIGVFRECLTHSTAWQVECRGWEADDVIATLAGKLKNVVVHTNDKDYQQLEGVTLNGVKPIDCPNNLIPLYKAMIGDPADNIAGIPNFGPKAWESLEGHWSTIEDAVHYRMHGVLEKVPFQKRHRQWVLDNVELLRAMLTVTRFMIVPDDELQRGITKGVLSVATQNALLARYFL